jgi:hypothetical protein
MAYSKANLKWSGNKASPCFRPFSIDFNIITELFVVEDMKSKTTGENFYENLSITLE